MVNWIPVPRVDDSRGKLSCDNSARDDMNKNRGADALAAALVAQGVRRLFTLSGNHVMPVFDAALDAGIDLVHVRHEAAAVHMADAWARITGQVGVALVTGGPGHANAVGALYTAAMAESPVVLLSGHAPLAELGKGAFQEMRQAEMAAPVTKASIVSQRASEVGADFTRAAGIALGGLPGPVHMSLPTDVLEVEIGPRANVAVATPGATGDADAAARIVMKPLAAGARPLVLCSAAYMTRPGRSRMATLEEASGIPVIGMESPRGVNDPALGTLARVLARADRVLLVGKRRDFTLRFGQALDPACGILEMDTGAGAFAAIEALARAATRSKGDAWRDEVRAAIAHRPPAWEAATGGDGRLHPVQALRPLQAILDSHPDSVLVCDGGEFGQWAQACLSAPHRVINGVAGSIGAGLPFAVAARCASPEAPVIAFMGDGTFGFHPAEIDTAVRYRLPFVAVVGNDARWNAEYQIQLRSYGPDRLVGCELLPTRYDQVAAAFGGHGELVTGAGELVPAVRRAIASRLPAVVNVMIEGLPAPVYK